jgi:adenosylcobinamide-GDP ribazoletransferase
MKKILLAFQFLTIIPVKDTGKSPEQEVGGATVYFPVVGLIEGVVLAILAWLFLKVFPGEITSGLLLFVMVIINGGLHLDGLSDTFDAVASRGDIDKKLLIMKDSTIGPAGVIAIVLVLLLKYLLLNSMFFYSSIPVYYTGLLLMPVLSRCTMVWAIFHCRPARQDGLGRMFIEHTGLKELITATTLSLIACFVTLGVIAELELLLFHLMFVLPVLYFFSVSAVWFFKKHLGGMTGDSFGSVYEIAILLFLTTRILWVQKFI